MTRKMLCLGWVVLPVQPGSEWVVLVVECQPSSRTGYRAWSSMKPGGCGAEGWGEGPGMMSP